MFGSRMAWFQYHSHPIQKHDIFHNFNHCRLILANINESSIFAIKDKYCAMPISLIRRFSLQLAKNFAEIYILGYALYNPHITIQTGSPMAKLYSKYAVNIKQKMHQNVTKLFN